MSAIPAGLHYEAKPAAIPVYRRRCITNAISSNEYVPGQTIKIPLDTAMHGSVLDTKQTMLQFQLNIKNLNPFADYLNFGRCGANGIIEAFRFMVNGNPVEKIINYAEIYEDMMIKLGINGDPFHFFHPNPFVPEEGPLHTNFIKPPMVDCMGNTMYRPQMLLDAACEPNVFYGNLSHQIKVDSDREKLGLGTTNASMLTPAGTVSGKDNMSESVFKYLPPGAFSTTPQLLREKAGVGEMMSKAFHNRITTADIPTSSRYDLLFNLADSTFSYGSGTDRAPRLKTDGATASDQLEEVKGFDFAKEIVIHEGVLGQQNIIISPEQAANQSYSVYTPAVWPYFIPKKRIVLPSLSNQRMQDISRYYSNCKSIPIGMRSNLTWDDYLLNSDAFYSNTTTMKTVNLNVVTPLLSGILGLGADKMFPDMLIAPGKAWLEIDLRDARKAFYVTMDPCRRIPGTIRDYVPYTGSAYGEPRLSMVPNRYLGSERLLPFYTDVFIPDNADNRGNFLATDTTPYFYDYFKTTLSGVVNDAVKLKLSMCYNSNACKGTHFMLHSNIPQFSVNDTGDSTSAGLIKTKGLTEKKNYWNSSDTTGDNNAVGYARQLPMSILGGAAIDKYTPPIAGGFLNAIKAMRTQEYATVTEPWSTATNYGYDGSSAKAQTTEVLYLDVQNPSTVGGIPIPQYVPVKEPWTVKNGLAASYYVPESECCYGTYLKSAVAQSRRTCAFSNNNPPTGLQMSTFQVLYGVSNVELITEQILLPDAVTSQILEGASQGAISYHTTFTGSVNQLAVRSTTQNQLLTVTGASVNNLTLLFRSSQQLLNDTTGQSYNSLAFYNPFASVEYDPSLPTPSAGGLIGNYDVGGAYFIKNALSTKKGENFNLQLKIGNEFIPRTPIRDLPTLLMENEKGIQTIADYTAKLPYFCPLINTTQTTDNLESFFDYGCLEDGFMSAFLPLNALDDQTITGNPFFAVVDLDPKNTRYLATSGQEAKQKTAGLRCPPEVCTTNSIGTRTTRGVLNKFTPLDGTFHICFNLDTFVLEGGSARCGTTIVNNQLFFQCQNMHMMTHKVGGVDCPVEILAIWQQDAKIVFEAGGNCVSYI